MICKNCGFDMQDDSVFCMNCGSKVVVEPKVEIKPLENEPKALRPCKGCGFMLTDEAIFCPECGDKQVVSNNNNNKNMKKYLLIGGISLVVIIMSILLVVILKNNAKSPIEGVSKKVYEQGQEYLEMMDTTSTKKQVYDVASELKDVSIDSMYKHMDFVDFNIKLGKKASEEEQYYADLIIKFWQKYVTYYTHETILQSYEGDDSTGVKLATTIYKGLISEITDNIAEAKKILKEADDLDDMKDAYEILDTKIGDT